MSLEINLKESKLIQWFIGLFEPKERFPDKPSREHWTCPGYEPYSWTQEDIDRAKAAGWTNIKIQPIDEYPYLKGTVHGTCPDIELTTTSGKKVRPNFYIPKQRI